MERLGADNAIVNAPLHVITKENGSETFDNMSIKPNVTFTTLPLISSIVLLGLLVCIFLLFAMVMQLSSPNLRAYLDDDTSQARFLIVEGLASHVV